jgi:hypothetical protein
MWIFRISYELVSDNQTTLKLYASPWNKLKTVFTTLEVFPWPINQTPEYLFLEKGIY